MGQTIAHDVGQLNENRTLALSHATWLKENTNNGQTMVGNNKQTTLSGNIKNNADYYEEMGNLAN